jgi:hypothetical protein
MSKSPPIKTTKGSNDTRPSQLFHVRRDSASSMYANPDTDPDYQQDPIIGREENPGGSNDQTDGRPNRIKGDQSTRAGGS